MTVGDRIRKQRELLGFSQTELAEKVNISKQTLYKYEKNIITNIPSDKIEQISKVLNVSESFLMGWDDNLSSTASDLIPDILSDEELLEHIEKLMRLSKEHKKTIYDNITYWYVKDGRYTFHFFLNEIRRLYINSIYLSFSISFTISIIFFL